MKDFKREQEADYVEHNGKYYLVSTIKMFSPILWYKWETMIFECGKKGEPITWFEECCMRYQNKEDAMKQHKYILEHIEEFL